jgi:hypothetical protein
MSVVAFNTAQLAVNRGDLDDIEITIDDPKAYTKPLTYTQRQRLLPNKILSSRSATRIFRRR